MNYSLVSFYISTSWWLSLLVDRGRMHVDSMVDFGWFVTRFQSIKIFYVEIYCGFITPFL